MAAETQFTVNTGMATISTANSNLDGTGTLGTVLTGASNGTLIKSITIKAQTSTTEGMVRLFVYDGANNRIMYEVPVPAVTKSATAQSFVKTLYLNYRLEAGFILKASTQNAETFNVLAEGLDWSYYTPSVRPESTNYTATTGMVSISTANSNLDGTGTIGTVLTAGVSGSGWKGCLIESVTVKATVNTTAGMVRLFIQDTGSTTKLLAEILVPAVTKSANASSFYRKIMFPGGLRIQAGYKLMASTENAENFSVTAIGVDWKYPLAVDGMLANNYTPVTGTATTSEELLQSYEVSPGIVAMADLFEVNASMIVTNNANNKTVRIYVNTSNSLSGATLIATHNMRNTLSENIYRAFPVVSDTALECYAGASGAVSSSQDSTAAGTTANVTVPSVSAGFWVLISMQKATAGDTATIRWSFIRNNKIG